MASRTPLHGGPAIALLWIVTQVILWAGVLAATLFLTLLLGAMIVAGLDPTNWKGSR